MRATCSTLRLQRYVTSTLDAESRSIAYLSRQRGSPPTKTKQKSETRPPTTTKVLGRQLSLSLQNDDAQPVNCTLYYITLHVFLCIYFSIAIIDDDCIFHIISFRSSLFPFLSRRQNSYPPPASTDAAPTSTASPPWPGPEHEII